MCPGEINEFACGHSEVWAKRHGAYETENPKVMISGQGGFKNENIDELQQLKELRQQNRHARTVLGQFSQQFHI